MDSKENGKFRTTKLTDRNSWSEPPIKEIGTSNDAKINIDQAIEVFNVNKAIRLGIKKKLELTQTINDIGATNNAEIDTDRTAEMFNVKKFILQAIDENVLIQHTYTNHRTRSRLPSKR